MAFPHGFWTKPLPSGLTPMTGSADWVASLASYSFGFSVKNWNASIYLPGATRPHVPITIDGTDNASRILEAALNSDGGIPFPAVATPSPDTDAEICVYQSTSDTVWELWRASSPTQNAPGAPALPWGEASHGDSKWHAKWGGRIRGVNLSPGYPVSRHEGGATFAQRLADAGTYTDYESPSWMATATSLPLFGGEITFANAAGSSIPHVIGIALPHALLSATPIWPAQRADGAGGPIPEGAFLRLPSSYVVDPALPQLIQMMCAAAKTYGFVVWDGGSGTGIRFEQQQTGDPSSWTTNQWTQPGGLFYVNGAFVYPSDMAALFPWSALEFVQVPAS